MVQTDFRYERIPDKLDHFRYTKESLKRILVQLDHQFKYGNRLQPKFESPMIKI